VSAALTALFFALGLSGWVFVKLHGRTGYGNAQAALMGAGATFVVAFIVVFTLVHGFMH